MPETVDVSTQLCTFLEDKKTASFSTCCFFLIFLNQSAQLWTGSDE